MLETTKFKVSATPIPGLLEIDVSLIEDARGWFQEKFQKQKLVAAGMPTEFDPIQQNISYNREKGVTRGFHAEPWVKYVSVIRGRVFAAFIDLRQKNFGKIFTIEIDEKKAVFVPKGIANSFQTLEDETYYSYLVNDHWSQAKVSEYKSVNLTDPKLDINWPIPLSQAVISEKDRNNPFLKDIEPF